MTTQAIVAFRCRCGQKFSVSAAHRGRRIRCRRCRAKARVPGDRPAAAAGERDLDTCDRRRILEQMGIDPRTARAAWSDERRRGRRCFYCAGRLDPAERAIVCASCRASTSPAAHPAEGSGEAGAHRPLVADPADDPHGLDLLPTRRAAAYGALFLAGYGGLAHTVFGAGLAVAVAVAVALALGGAWLVYDETRRARLAWR